jgi:hypothetical protein
MCLPAANGAPKITFLTMKMLLATSLSFLVLIAMPVALSAARYWQTPFRLVGSRPLQCRPASPCPRAFGFVGPRLFGAHGALEGHLCHSHLDRAEARRPPAHARRDRRLQVPQSRRLQRLAGPKLEHLVATILAAVPEIGVTLPATAIGKDFSLD